MFNRSLVFPVSRRRGGVALVIVLAFVVLLTGLIVAFFSRAVAKRQVSNSSANGTRVDVFAAGAVNTVLGDFRQEIAAGSTTVTTSPAVAGLTIYNPNAGAAAPCLSGTTLTEGLPNLVKRSAYGQSFYTGSAYTAAGFSPSSRAANSSTATAAQNGRAISPARWNKALLLPKKTPTSETDFTPVNKQGTYAPPDWIVVARDGTNPVTWSTALAVNGTNQAIGRFAYNVYNEGGLLDANAVGYPTVGALTTPLANSPVNLPAYKGSLAFADLKQLPGIGTGTDSLGNTIAGLPVTRQEQVVRTLLGWRNYASTGIDPTQTTPVAGSPVSGSVNVLPGYVWTDPFTTPPGTGTNAFNFLNFARANGNGFLRTANPLIVKGQSDRLFGSRQQLLNLLLQNVADQSQSAGATAERTSLQNAMQYLGTFSRSLSQPSFVPPTGRPQVLALNAGGNYEGPQGNDGSAHPINPAFLSVRVLTNVPGGRNDGTDLVAGEPLVKKRFPLNRLAWLTYQGPSQGHIGPDTDDLKGAFGYTQAFLDQGTATAIQKYFGLTWDLRGFWVYNVHVGSTGIKTLDVVQQENREPDFIELLKAAITAGTLGKSGAQSGGSPAVSQFTRDSSIDCQIIQLAANIIDQFDVDGFPTRIQFPAYNREFRGVENLPYLYRVRNGLYRIINPVPMPAADPGADWYPLPTTGPVTSLTNGGTFIMVEQPEVWNPHSYDSTNTQTINRSLGYPRPQNLQLNVYGGNPTLPPAVPVTGSANAVFPRWRGSNIGSGMLGSGLNDTTTKMRFSNLETLYREPTLLIKPGVPAGSNLQAPGFLQAAANDGLIAYTISGGIKVLDSAAMPYMTSPGVSAEPLPGIYIGIYLGRNVVAVNGDSGDPDHTPNGVRIAGQANCAGPQSMTYQIQCDSATGSGMDTYDEKFFSDEPYTDGLGFHRGMLNVSTTDTNSYSGRMLIGCSRIMTCFDPRTSRFGMLNSITGDTVYFQDQELPAPGLRSPGTPRWVDLKNNVVSSNRLDANAGFGMGNGFASGAPSNGPPAGSYGWVWDGQLLRFGLFTQNNPSIPNDNLRFAGDLHSNSLGNPAAQYYADADGVVRRAAGAYVTSGTAPTVSASTTVGLPMATAYQPASAATRQKESRPIILNRPFYTVAELGYVFSDTPWKNIDLSTVQSGYAPLLDVFCVNDNDDRSGLVAGKVDLNTRQTCVLQAILNGAYKDEYYGATNPSYGGTSGPTLSVGEAQTLAANLVVRTISTTSGKGPLVSLADLVGGWKSGGGISPFYDGFSADLNSTDPYTNNIFRYRESAIRALSAVGNTRVWNLLIDLVAQTGRYPQSASGLDKFIVEGEQRYWVHVAIDRYTGQVIDKQVEIVKE